MAQRKAEPGPVVRVLTAAATRIRADRRGKVNKPQAELWQGDAWDVFDLIPEVGQSVTFMANVVSGVRLFIALRPEDAEEAPGPAPDGTVGLLEAKAVLNRVATGSVHGGMGGLLAASVANLKVPGEAYLLGEPAIPPDPGGKTIEQQLGRDERWDVKSTDEVEVKDKAKALIKDRPGTAGREVKIGTVEQEQDPAVDDIVFLLRVWDRHPRYSALARSSLRAALEVCEELLLLSRAIRGRARSQAANAGIIVMSSDFDIPGSPADDGDEAEDPEVTPFMRKLAKALTEPIRDETSPEASTPLVIQGPFEQVKEGFRHLSIAAQFDPEVRAIRAELIGRLGSALDLPIEQVTGIAGVNHWGAWQIDGASWARYGQPTTRLIVESWTEGLLWPMLLEAGVDAAAARRLMIWFDPAEAIMDPDESKTADELLDRRAIGYAAYRSRKGAGEDEAPSEEDWALFARAAQTLRPSSQPGDGTGPPNDGQPPDAAATLIRPAASNGNGHRPPVVSAGGRGAAPLGRRLMDIDRQTRARLEEIAELALKRSLERAGARVRSRAQRDANIAAAVAEVPNHLVCSRLGRSVVGALDLSEDDLLAEGIDEAEPRFDQRVASAQRRTRQALAAQFGTTVAEEDALERQQETDRHEAWVWLAGALLALSRDRLFNPAVVPPAQGELTTSSTVPASILRNAMSIAGGGDLGEGMPQGGVATGRLVLDLWARHGQVVGGWEWVHGEPDRPFPAHEDLDGVQFATWEDPLLAVRDEDSWLDTPFYQPGDHAGCTCDFIPIPADEFAQDEGAMAEASA